VAALAGLALLPKSFRQYWYEGKTKGYRWYGVEKDTTQRYREEVPQGMQVLAPKVGRYIYVLGETTHPGMVVGMVVPKGTVVTRIA